MREIKKFNLLSKEELQLLYIKQGNAPAVAALFGIHETTVRKRLKALNIPIRECGSWRRGVLPWNKSDLVGQVFGRIVVVKYSHTSKLGQAKWLCKCKCGKEFTTGTHSLKHGMTRSCGCLRMDLLEDGKSCQQLSSTLFRRLERGAKIRGLVFELTPEFLWELYEKQSHRCAFSGVRIKLTRPYDAIKNTASLDRIDSSKGYIPANVCWVHKTVNKMKWKLRAKEFVYWCKRIGKNRGKKWD